MTSRTYVLPSEKHEIKVDQLSSLDPDDLERIVRHWFFEHFEHPDDRTPYDSEEGGYIWIWGGPYSARDEICSEFLDILSEEALEPIITKLECESTEWGPAETYDDYDDDYVDDLASISDYYHNFSKSIELNESLSNVDLVSTLLPRYHQMLYANIITTMETYLSTAFINTTINDINFKRKFVETTPEFKEEKFPVSDIFNVYNTIDSRIHKYLSEIMWHNLIKVKLMYKATLDVNFPDKIRNLFQAIAIRHDIVHRSGFSKDGNEHRITTVQLSDLRDSIKSFVSVIEGQLARLKA